MRWVGRLWRDAQCAYAYDDGVVSAVSGDSICFAMQKPSVLLNGKKRTARQARHFVKNGSSNFQLLVVVFFFWYSYLLQRCIRTIVSLSLFSREPEQNDDKPQRRFFFIYIYLPFPL